MLTAHGVAGNSAPTAAEPAKLAAKSLLIDVAGAGKRLVAVGERGLVLYSDDAGNSWAQAKKVPTQALLNGVCFFDAQHGVAVGHDETILVTRDAGITWSLTHYAPEKQQPLLDVWCGSSGQALAVGAYSAFYESRDGGATWTSRVLDAKPASRSPPATAHSQAGAATEDAYDDGLQPDYHLNRVAAASASRLYIAAEAGHVYRSDDAGATWIELPSPYEGSFFGVLPLSENEVLVFGLRGNLFRSSDAGQSWQKVPTRTTAMLNDGVKLNDGRVVIVGLSGVVLLSQDSGRTFATSNRADRKGYSAAWPAGESTLAVVGEGGARLLNLSREPGVVRNTTPHHFKFAVTHLSANRLQCAWMPDRAPASVEVLRAPAIYDTVDRVSVPDQARGIGNNSGPGAANTALVLSRAHAHRRPHPHPHSHSHQLASAPGPFERTPISEPATFERTSIDVAGARGGQL